MFESGIRKQRRRRFWSAAGLLLAGVVVVIGVGLWRLRSQKPPLAPALPPVPVPQEPPPPPGPPGIVLHDSDSPASWRGIPINAAQLELIHARDHPDWKVECEGKTYHIGYHYVILPDGTIEKGRPDLCIGAHARKHNTWLGICLIGAFSKKRKRWWPSEPTPQQLDAVLTLCKELMSKYHIPPEMVKRHRDVNYTYCPGERFPYETIIEELRAYAVLHPETQPLPRTGDTISPMPSK